jgi:hypothetical protein
MFQPYKRPSSGHSLENNSIKTKTYEMLAQYGIPCGFTTNGLMIASCKAETCSQPTMTHFNTIQVLCLTDSSLVNYCYNTQRGGPH